jgi:putative transposase
MYLAPTRKAALAAYGQFISSYQVKFPKACECLNKDKEVLFTFYDFPAQHWPHYGRLTPSNRPSRQSSYEPIEPRVAVHESPPLTMVFKLGLEDQKIGAAARI